MLISFLTDPDFNIGLLSRDIVEELKDFLEFLLLLSSPFFRDLDSDRS